MIYRSVLAGRCTTPIHDQRTNDDDVLHYSASFAMRFMRRRSGLHLQGWDFLKPPPTTLAAYNHTTIIYLSPHDFLCILILEHYEIACGTMGTLLFYPFFFFLFFFLLALDAC